MRFYKKSLVIVASVFFGVNVYAASTRVNNFRAVSQGNAPWCWAAVSEMMIHQQKGQSPKMCEIVSSRVGRNCCAFITPSQCWQGDSIQETLSSYGVGTLRHLTGGNESNTGNVQRGIEPVVRAIRANKLVILELHNVRRGGPHHTVVVYGVRNFERLETLEFELQDPVYGRGNGQRIKATQLLNAYYTHPNGEMYYWRSTLIPR